MCMCTVNNVAWLFKFQCVKFAGKYDYKFKTHSINKSEMFQQNDDDVCILAIQ